MRLHAFYVLLGLIIAACANTGPTPTITITPSPQEATPEAVTEEPPALSPTSSKAANQASSVTPAANLEPKIEDGISIEAADGIEVAGTLYKPGESGVPLPGVLLIHMLGSDRTAWEEFAIRLALEGYVALAIDMRGHGDTGGDRDFDKAAQDLQRVWAYFSTRTDVDGDRTAVVGASIGANMALVTAAKEPAIDTAVLLSPGLVYREVTTEDAIVEYGSRPLMIVASTEDTYAAQSSQQLEDLARGEVRLILYSGAGHGTDMLVSQTELADEIIGWLDSYID